MDIGKFLASHWGDLASVLGLGFTIWAVINAKRAAEAAGEARDRIALLDTLADASTAIAIIEEIKRLQRAEAWTIALDRYSALRGCLIRVERISLGLSDSQRQDVLRSIAKLRAVENKLERSISQQNVRPELAALNGVLSKEIERMERVMIAIKQAGR